MAILKGKFMKKVIIIGGGVSGFASAIYLRLNGYDTLILEKNATVGGACIGWYRQGCYIDGCIHWLVGTKRGSKTYKLWEDVGALVEDTPILFPEEFYTLNFPDGVKFTVPTDLDKLQIELIKVCRNGEFNSVRQTLISSIWSFAEFLPRTEGR